MRPLLLIDVDGPLNVYHAPADDPMPEFTKYRLAPRGVGYTVWLSRKHGPMLLDFAEETGVELAWCTTWEHHANRLIRHKVGLPELPVVEFGYRAREWKFSGVYPYAGDRPVAWFDDDFDLFPREREWFLGKRGDTPTLLHHVDPGVGIVQADLDAVRDWLIKENL